MMKFKLEGSREFQRAMDELGEDARERVGLQVQRIANDLARNIRQNYAKQGTGTTYFRIPGSKYMTIRAGSRDGPPVAFVPGGGSHNLSLQHTASRPVQPPAQDTGRLLNSVEIRKVRQRTFELGTRLDYAPWLEYGTRKIKKRPNWVPETEKARKRFDGMVQQVLAAAIRKRRAGR